MATLTNLPAQAIIDGFKGTIDFYMLNGVPVARKWPRSPGHDRSPAVQATWPTFTAAVHAWPTLSEEVQSSYREMAMGSGISGRDLFIKGYIKGIYRYSKGENMYPSCWAFVASAFDNLVSGNWYTVPFDGEVYDYGGNFDPVNYWYLAPRTARYHVIVNILFTTMVAVGQRWLRIEQNGVEKVATREDNLGTGWQVLQLSAILHCAQGDKITAGVMQGSGADTVDVGAFSNWSNMFVAILDE